MITRKIKIITTMIIATAFMVGCSNTVEDDDVIATVNGEDITVGYYKKTLELEKQEIEDERGSGIWEEEVEGGVKFKEQFKKDVLNDIVNSYAIYDKAKDDGLLPSEEEIQNGFDIKKSVIELDENHKYLVEELGIDDTYIREQQEKLLAVRNYKNNFNDKFKISDKEIKDYYNNHQNEFYIEQVNASHILISTNDETGMPLSEDMKKQAKEKAEELLNKIKDGADFEMLAIENSDCSSKNNGGNLGYFKRGAMVERFDYAVFSLDENEISDVVETEYGYHIIKLIDKKNELMTFEQARYLAEIQLLDGEFDKEVEEILKNLDIEKNEKIINKIDF